MKLKAMDLLLFVSIAFLPVKVAEAGLIDFESGFANGDVVGLVTTTTNQVTFSVTGGGNGFIADVGGQYTAFWPNDTPSGGNPGSFFLTDEFPRTYSALGYFLSFAFPVLHLSLDLYDYEGAEGAYATLTVFEDVAMTIPIGTDVYTHGPTPPPDGNVRTLSVLAPAGLIRTASLVFINPDNGTGIDNITFATATDAVTIDIKPQSCPNLINVKGRGVLQVAILGTPTLDVNNIDLNNVYLEGLQPRRSYFRDVSTPFSNGGADPCLNCTEEGPDGELDLVLKFDKREIVAALGEVGDGDCVELILTGELLDPPGTPISGSGHVLIKKKGKP